MAETLNYRDLTLVPVPGTPDIHDFHISTTPVTQALWAHVMGSNPAPDSQPRYPVTHVSWDDVTRGCGFLERINALGLFPGRTFRLPSDAEWEYAARGGCHHNWDIHCTNAFRYSQPAGQRGKDLGFRLVLA